jgi:methylenetetrahydrofolate reductase (NADPH)
LPLFRRTSHLAPSDAEALARALAAPAFELIPLASAFEKSAALPAGATVTVTSSPAKGVMATADLAVRLAALGFEVVPHLSARLTRDRPQLLAFLQMLRDAGIDRAFVIGGDPAQAGPYPDALALLREMADLGVLPQRVGIAAYPQGHPKISDADLLAALAAKAPFASWMTTQLCFDAHAIGHWIAERRADGVSLPAEIGVPGVAQIPKLLEVSARIGVRDATAFIRKNTAFVGQLLTSGGAYRPTGLLESLAPVLSDPTSGVSGLHLYTFNDVEATERWRRTWLAELSSRVGSAAPASPASP